ncbi:hypothetical protein BJX66DRAFT_338475 [Aspergillus keveii]|uniref:Uncharacterized protein n=1 Tax=Aspergillus keveii TaxID=714993 RepID=A0ABR4G509_9EURO
MTPKAIRHCLNTAIQARHDWIAIDLLDRICQADGRGKMRKDMVAYALEVAVQEENTAMVEHIIERILETGVLYEAHILDRLRVACSFKKARSVEAFVSVLRAHYEKEAQNPPQTAGPPRSSWPERIEYLSSTLLEFGRRAPFNSTRYAERQGKALEAHGGDLRPKNFSEDQCRSVPPAVKFASYSKDDCFRFLCTLDLPEVFVQDLSEYLQATLGVSDWASLAGEWHLDRVA